jgi:Arc/MetJ-type ribon-helix-helix transcriptional regulator
MTELSKTAKAAQKAVNKGEASKIKVTPPEEMVRQVRLHVKQNLFVSNMDYIAAVVHALDDQIVLNAKLTEEVRLLDTLSKELSAARDILIIQRDEALAFVEAYRTVARVELDLSVEKTEVIAQLVKEQAGSTNAPAV